MTQGKSVDHRQNRAEIDFSSWRTDVTSTVGEMNKLSMPVPCSDSAAISFTYFEQASDST